MSIVQGGNGFPFFAGPVYEYIATGKFTEVKVDDIGDGDLRFAAAKV